MSGGHLVCVCVCWDCECGRKEGEAHYWALDVI